MRLLHCTTMRLREFMGIIPPYAILSHTWEDEEVLFNMVETKGARRMKGYKKIRYCCDAAVADGFEFVWIDTCCINKTSSAELSEAINSMFRWYQKAQVCYVYLSDVQMKPMEPTSTINIDTQINQSRWLTRGWTLQELLAPSSVIFMSSDWEEIGTKISLVDKLTEFTGIHKEALLGAKLTSFSVAQRMSWASNRQTTRSEDLAYCLLGVFGVNMPMLYGEGTQAFIRLQEEIIKTSDDHSIFAWQLTDKMHGGILGPNPASFRESGDIVRSTASARMPYLATNKGVHLQVAVISRPDPTTFWAVLDCHRFGRPELPLVLELVAIPGIHQYIRKQWILQSADKASLDRVRSWKGVYKWKDVFVKQDAFDLGTQLSTDSYLVRLARPLVIHECLLRINSNTENQIKLIDACPSQWIEKQNSGIPKYIPSFKVAGVLKFTSHGSCFVVVLYLDGEILTGVLEEDPEMSLESYFMSYDESHPKSSRRIWRGGSDRLFHPIPKKFGTGVSVNIRKIRGTNSQGGFAVNVEWQDKYAFLRHLF